MSMMNDLQEMKHFYEQEAYNEIRTALQKDFIKNPTYFMEHFGQRPEDLPGSVLREYYPHFLAMQLPIKSTSPTFRKRFSEGRIF